MAIQTKLGRVQGAGVFVTTVEAYSGANQQYVPRSSIFPTEDRGVKPLVGDTIIFANGIVGTILDVQSSSSIRCAANSLFSLKGKDGLNITKVEQTTTSTESGGINVVTFTLSDGSKYNVQIANGQEGGSGVDGLVVKQEGDENILYLTKADETFGEGIPLPKSGGSGGGSTNFILNPDFSVNQRGQAEYTGTQTVDCFKQNTVEGYNVKSTPKADGIELKVSAENAENGKALFTQTIEDAKKLEGKTVTLSANVSSVGGGDLMLGYTSKSEGSNEIGGTVVPNDGTVVESVYVNTALSPGEVNSIIASANLSFVDYNGMPAYFALVAGTTALGIYNLGDGYYGLGTGDLTTGDMTTLFTGEQWLDFTNPVEFNAASINNLQGMPIGEENNKLLDIFSTTPNFGSGSSSGGTPVPNDGTVVDTIYFNTSLSGDEVKSVLNSIEYEKVDAVEIYYVALLEDYSKYLAILKMGDDFAIGSFVDGASIIIYQSSQLMGETIGWQGVYNFAFNANAEGSTSAGQLIGYQNSKLASIISITPDFGGGSGMVGEFIPLKNGMNSLTFTAKNLKECGIYSSANMGVETVATIHSIKLELGEEATDHLPTVTNDEKVRCQRVYQPVSLNGVVGYAKDESTLAVSVPLPVSMRALPSIEDFETISILGGAEVTAIAVDSIENNSVQLSLTTSGLTEGNLYVVKNGKVWLSADSPTVRVLFCNGDKVFFAKVVVEGGEFSVPSDPTKESTAQYNYVFKGWSLDGVNVVDVETVATSDLTYYALYEEQLRYYTVRFLNGDTVLQTSEVAYGQTPVYAGQEPTDPSGNAFAGWNPAIGSITGNVDYVAMFSVPSVTRALIDRSITSYSNDTITSVGRYAFYKCTSLTSVSLPNVTYIASSPFQMCSGLTSVSLPATPPTLENTNAFLSINANCVFHVPTGSLSAYQNATNWSTLTGQYTFTEDE